MLKGTTLLVVGGLLVVLLCIGGYAGYWWLAKNSTARRYEINTGTQQYQSSLISQERDRATAYDRALDPGQKIAIADQFCAVYPEMTNPTPDLVTRRAVICTP